MDRNGDKQTTNRRFALLTTRKYSIKGGRVVVLLNGRFAGRKAIVVKTYSGPKEGEKEHKGFEHALVAGIDRYPRKVTRSMKEDRIKKRSQIKPFVKHINLNHIMPTRYQLSDMDLKKVVGEFEKRIRDGDSKDACKAVKKVFEDRYRKQGESKSAKNVDGAKYFFKKLRF